MNTGSNCARCGTRLTASGGLEGLCARCVGLATLALEQADLDGQPAGHTGARASARHFGDYQLLEEIGRGGMGVVFRARQVSLDRIVAVKMVLAGQFAGADSLRRLRAEASAAGRLRHPNIVSVHEVGEHEGQPFFSMELVEGQSLAELVRDKPLPPRQAAAYLKTIAEAIQYAHEQGVIHRDLKPSNILIDQMDAPRITDFGLAKRVQPQSGSQNPKTEIELTLTGQTIGTPNYMPPEQVAAQPGQASPLGDIYSLGAILYHLLTGRPLFLAASVESALHQLLHTEPVPPRLLNPGIARDLETICLKCLNKEPRSRYLTARALAEDLCRWLNGESILARPASAPEKFWRWCRRKPALAALSGALLLAVLGGVSGILWQWRRAETNASDAQLSARQAREELWRAQLAQARAERRTGEAGQQFNSLEAVTRAAAIRPSLELRNEAIAALTLTDLRFVPVWTNPYSSIIARFSHGLERFAVASPAGPLKLFRTSDGREEMALPAVGGVAQRFIFSPDNRFLAARYSTGSNVVWELSTQTPVLGWGPSVVHGEFAAASEQVLCPDRSGLIRCVTLRNGQERWRCNTSSELWTLVAQPQGKYFATHFLGGPDLQVRDLNTGELVRTLTHPSSVATMAWSPDGKTLVVGLGTGWLYAWEVDSDAAPRSWKGHDQTVVDLGFERSSRYLATSSWDWSIGLWSLPGYRLGVVARGCDSFQCDFSADGRRLSGYRNPVLGLYEVVCSSFLHRIHVPPGDGGGAWGVDINGDGKLVAAAYTDGVRVLDFATGAELQFRAFYGCRSVIFTPDGSGLLVCGPLGLARWAIERLTTTGKVRLGPRETISDEIEFSYASLSADGRWVAAANRQAGCVAVFEVNHPENQFTLTNHPSINHVAFSPDGRWMASGTWQGSGVRIWDMASRRLVKELPVEQCTVRFSPDSRLLVTGAQRYQVWEAGTWRELYLTTGKGAVANPSAFSPDGRILAVVKDLHVVQLLEAASGRVLAELDAPGSTAVYWLRFSPDGATLLALEWNRQIQVWDLRRLRTELAALNLDWAD